jgi:hypothetical protein
MRLGGMRCCANLASDPDWQRPSSRAMNQERPLASALVGSCFRNRKAVAPLSPDLPAISQHYRCFAPPLGNLLVVNGFRRAMRRSRVRVLQ